MPRTLQTLLLAVQFFTRLPLPAPLARRVNFSPELMQRAMACMPAAGWVTGAAAALVFNTALALWATPATAGAAAPLLMLLAAALSTAAGLLLTGGLHEDGLADVADALGGQSSPERALQIMKDSQVGGYAVLALCMALLLKVCLIALLGMVLPVPLLGWLLVAAHVLSRFFPLLLSYKLPHVALAGLSKTRQMAGTIKAMPLWPGALCCLPLLGFYGLPSGVWLLSLAGAGGAACFVASVCMGLWFKRRIGGFTGDCLGATQQVCELAFYLAALTAAARA